jgi:hypothetical protein
MGNGSFWPQENYGCGLFINRDDDGSIGRS